MSWSWTRLDDPSPAGSVPPGGWAARMATETGTSTHIVANAGDGSRVGHFSIASAAITREPDLALRRASSAIAAHGSLVVAGVAADSDRPGLCIVASGQPSRTVLLDDVAGTEALPVAAWPQLAVDEDGARVWVVWAAGGPTTTIRAMLLTGDDLETTGPSVAVPRLYGLQAARGVGGGAVALWDTGVGVGFRHVAGAPSGPSAEVVDSDVTAAAVLTAGAVVWPTGGSAVAVRDLASGRRRDVRVPAASEGSNARISWATLAYLGGIHYLIWATQRPPEHAEDGGALCAPSRAWIAALDDDRDPEAADELPAGVRSVVGFGRSLLAVPVDGPPLAWLGSPGGNA